MSQAKLRAILDSLINGSIDRDQAAEALRDYDAARIGDRSDSYDLYERIDHPSYKRAAYLDDADIDEDLCEAKPASRAFIDVDEMDRCDSPLFSQGDSAEQNATIDLEQIAYNAGLFVSRADRLAKYAMRRIADMARQPDRYGDIDPQPIRTLTVRSVGRRVRIVADSDVKTCVVEGPHTMTRSDHSVEIITEGQFAEKGALSARSQFSVAGVHDIAFGQELVVRINPLICINAEVRGSRLIVMNCPSLGHIRVSAGSMRLIGIQRLDDGLVQVGRAEITGCLRQGRSRFAIESGSATIKIDRDSDMTIIPSLQLGAISWPDGTSGPMNRYIVKEGRAHLDIGVVMAKASITWL